MSKNIKQEKETILQLILRYSEACLKSSIARMLWERNRRKIKEMFKNGEKIKTVFPELRLEDQSEGEVPSGAFIN